MTDDIYTRDEFIRTGSLRGYGTKGQFTVWADKNPKAFYTEDDLIACHRCCSNADTHNPNLRQNSYCHITPEDAASYGMPVRSDVYLYHPDHIYKDKKEG